MREMFHLASLHNIKPIVERMPLEKCNEAVDKLMAGKARYRCDTTLAQLSCALLTHVFVAVRAYLAIQ